jgi:hypothetical protein
MGEVRHRSSGVSRCRVAAALALLATVAPAAQGPAFDAASLKVNRSGFPGGVMDFRAGNH